MINKRKEKGEEERKDKRGRKRNGNLKGRERMMMNKRENIIKT